MKKKGFTLVELLVVIAILAILATVSIVGYTSFIGKANESNCLTEATQIRDIIIAEDIQNKNFKIGDTGAIVGEKDSTVYFKVVAKTDSTAQTGVKYYKLAEGKTTAYTDVLTDATLSTYYAEESTFASASYQKDYEEYGINDIRDILTAEEVDGTVAIDSTSGLLTYTKYGYVATINLKTGDITTAKE